MELKRLEYNLAIAAYSRFIGHQVNFDDAESIQRGFGYHKERFMANKNCVNGSSRSEIHPAGQPVMDALW